MLRRLLLAIVALALSAGAGAQTGLRPPAQAKPKPAAKAVQTPAVENAGVRAVEEIFACLAEGLPKEWRRVWVVVAELAGDGGQRSFEGRFFFSLDAAGDNPLPLVPCNAGDVALRVVQLDEFLEPEKRRWKAATLTITSGGKFDLKYDYAE